MPGRVVDEVAVHAQLVADVRRVLPALRRDRLGAVEYAVLPGRNDVQKSAGIAELPVMAGRLGATVVGGKQDGSKGNQRACQKNPHA